MQPPSLMVFLFSGGFSGRRRWRSQTQGSARSSLTPGKVDDDNWWWGVESRVENACTRSRKCLHEPRQLELKSWWFLHVKHNWTNWWKQVVFSLSLLVKMFKCNFARIFCMKMLELNLHRLQRNNSPKLAKKSFAVNVIRRLYNIFFLFQNIQFRHKKQTILTRYEIGQKSYTTVGQGTPLLKCAVSTWSLPK